MKYNKEIREELLEAIEDFKGEVMDILKDSEDSPDECASGGEAPKPEFKVGQKVRIRKDLEVHKHYGANSVNSVMLQYLGKETTISWGDTGCGFRLYVDDGEWYWTPEMLESVNIKKKPKFKVGQKVKVVKRGSHFFELGAIVEVVGTGHWGVNSYTCKGKDFIDRDVKEYKEQYIKEEDIVALSEEEPEKIYKYYKPGTKAVVIGYDFHHFKLGTIVTITEDDRWPYCVDSKGVQGSVEEKNLQVITQE